MTVPTMSPSVHCCEQQANQGGYFLLNLRSCPKEQDPTWDISLGFGTNLPGLIRSFAETGEELHLRFDSAKRVAEAAVGIRHRTIPADWFGATVGRYFLHPRGQRRQLENLAKVDRRKTERINQELQEEFVPDIPNRSCN